MVAQFIVMSISFHTRHTKKQLVLQLIVTLVISLPTMSSKILHIIRHGESEANILLEEKAKEMGYNGMHDALIRMNNQERTKLIEPLYRRKKIDYKLTEKGYKQAMFLQNDTEILT